MRRQFGLLTLLLLFLLPMGVSRYVAQGSREAFLQVFDVQPAPVAPLSSTQAVTFYFNRRVDCAAAESALRWTPAIKGAVSCDEYSLSFQPSTAYERNRAYTFELTKPLRAQDGALLLDDFLVTYLTGGYLQVAEVLPAAAAAPAPADSSITVVFDRPIVPLALPPDLDDLPQPLSFSPSVEGDGEWVTSAIYTFTPRPPLQSDSAYTVTIAADLRAIDGSVLEADYAWSFRTAAPALLSIDPPPGAPDIALDPKIQMRFSQVLDQTAVEAAFYFRDLPHGEVAGSFEWAEDGMGFAFTPGSRLKLDTEYEAGFLADNLSSLRFGNLPAEGAWRYQTAPAPAINLTEPLDGAADADRSGFSLFFASAMNIETLPERIRIEPKPEIEPRVYYSDWSKRYTVSFDAQPSTSYTIRIAPGMEDIYGNAIAESLTFTYTTAPREPALGLQVPGPVGFYNAYQQPVQVHVYHRGVAALDLALSRVPLEDFIASLTQPQYYDPTSEFTPRADQLLDRWRIESNTPVNITRYELLSLGAEGALQEDGCARSPVSRLAVGTAAQVTSAPDPLRARLTPVDGDIIQLLHRGYETQIEAGPRCVDGLRWWQVALQDGGSAWVAEGADDDYFLAPGGGGALVAGSHAGGLAPGIYFLEATAPGLERYAWQNRHFLNVSTAVLTLKQATDRLTIWAIDVNSGAPISGERINIYGPNSEVLGGGVTDEHGTLQLDIPYSRDLYLPYVAVLSTSEHFGIGFTDWSNGAEPWLFGYDFTWSPRAYQTFLYTDRPVYRTGQPVYFRGIVRSKDDVVYMPASIETAPVTIRDAQGEVVYQRDLALSDFGTFSDEFNIAADGSLGAYSLTVDLPTGEDFVREGGGIGFLVAEYRLPEYQVTLSTSQPEIVQGDSSAFALESRYFFGGSVSYADLDYVVYSAPYTFNYTGDGNYDFTDHSPYESGSDRLDFSRLIMEGALATDGDGKAQFDVVGDLQSPSRSQLWRVEASIRDEAGQAIYGHSNLIVHQGLLYVGARAESAVGRVGEDSHIALIAVGWDSAPIANQSIDVAVVERRWTSVQEQDQVTGATTWTWDVEEIPITTGRAHTAADGKADFVFQPPNGGLFKVTVSTRDAAGNHVQAATYAWVSGSGYVHWRQENNNTLPVVPDKINYSVGERAKVLLASPFEGAAEALVSIERGDVLSIERVTLSSNSHIYEFEILPQHAPNIYLSVFLVKPAGDGAAVAAWRLGMTELLVDIEQKALTIEISADQDSAAPQEEVEYRLRVTDYKGEPVIAEVGIGVTDLAALSLAARNSDGLLESFYGPQALSVRTSSSLVVNADAFAAALAEQKGGGGGLFEAGIVDLRGEFVDTAYWNAAVITDAAGEARIGVKLPDNLTTWRLDARALTEGRQGRLLVGEGRFDLVSTRPLLIRPVTPRFFVVGDTSQLAAVVNNNTSQEIHARVSLQNIAGLALADGGESEQDIVIPGGGRQRVSWLVDVGDEESVAPVFVVRAINAAFADASISPVSMDSDGALPVYNYDVRATVGTAGSLRKPGARAESILLPRDLDVQSGRLDIRIDKSLAAVTAESLTYLEAETRRYRECASTVVSRFLPNIVSYRALNELRLAQPALKARLDALVEESLQTLYARQLANGGWSWCSHSQADVMTTAYALIGLAQAQRQAYPVDEHVMQRAQRFLAGRLITPSLEIEPWRLNRQAFLLYALAESGAPDIARSSILYERHERLNLDAIAFLAQALHRINPDDQVRLDALTQVMFSRAVTRASGAFFEETYDDRRNWSSDIRSTALVLNALVKIRPASELLPNIVRHLVSAREGRGHWSTFQENSWSIIALTNWMLASGELEPDFIYSVALNGLELLRDAALPDNAQDADEVSIDIRDLVQGESNLVEFERGDGEGALYYTAHLNIDLPVDEVSATSRGVEISRIYTLLGDETRAAIDGAAVGDMVQVRLQIVAPNTLRYLVIEDFFPAGAEAINPELATSPQLGTYPGGERIDPGEQGWGWWFFDHIEFHDERAIIYASTLPRGVYEFVYTIRPSIAGEFNVIPPVAQELYFPEVYGRGDGALFTITE